VSDIAPTPLFSIITVVRNAVGTIENCIQSVTNQSFADFEYIVIDGLSDDGTSELISKHLNSIHTYVREKDLGIYDAMNKAITMCRGKYIGIINADDAYFENTLMNVERSIVEYPESQIIYGGVQIISQEGGTLYVEHGNLDQAMIPHPSCFVMSDAYRHFGMFNSELKIAADYDFMLRAYKAGAVFHNTGLILAKYRSGGASAKNRFKSIQEMISIQANHLGWSKFYRNYRFLRYLAATYLIN
jgi:glycosyltransferase involved in cell wall biosynthesis